MRFYFICFNNTLKFQQKKNGNMISKKQKLVSDISYYILFFLITTCIQLIRVQMILLPLSNKILVSLLGRDC